MGQLNISERLRILFLGAFNDFGGLLKMGLGNDAIKVDSWDVKKSKGRKKKVGDDDAAVKETRCCISLRFIGCCVTSRSKVDSSVSSISTNGNVFICF